MKPVLLLSIRPEHAHRIFAGAKRYELRKVLPKARFGMVYLYASGGEGLLGYFSVDGLLKDSPDRLWGRVGTAATSEDRFSAYFSGRSVGYAIGVKHAKQFPFPVRPTLLKRYVERFSAPQSFLLVQPGTKLFRVLEGLRSDFARGRMRKVALRAIADGERQEYGRLVTEIVGSYYDDISPAFALANLETHDSGAPAGAFMTSAKEVLTILGPRSTPIGFTTLTYKLGGSVKSGPTILFPAFRGQGYGQAVRSALEERARAKRARKLYATAPDSSERVVSYLLRAGYTVEAHLDRQYSSAHGEIVFGKMLDRRRFTPMQQPARTRERARVASLDALNCNLVAAFLADQFSRNWLRVTRSFASDLIENALRGSHIAYEDRPKELIILTRHNKPIAAAILIPKRGGAVKSFFFSTSRHKQTLQSLFRAAHGSCVRRRARKLFAVHRIGDSEMIDALASSGFEPEGILREPYRPGEDAIVLSKFV